MNSLNRRSFLVRGFAATAATLGTRVLALAQTSSSVSPASEAGKVASPTPAPNPPPLAPDKVRAVVGQSHRNLEEVKKLVMEDPLLVNATWDFGGGDFESPLQAAAHTGRREIAEYLLRHGARPDLFAAAMLGQVDFIKAALSVYPSLLDVHGPHGWTLLHCAKQGAAGGKPAYDFLLSQSVPEVFRRTMPFKNASPKPT